MDPKVVAIASAGGRSPSALLERERELSELEAVVGELADGGGRLVVIEAQAGLGKTRLLQAARATAAQAGMRVLGARATELERDFPFALVRQLFEPLLTGADAAERDALLEAANGAARGALGMRDDPAAGGAGDAYTVLHGLYRLTAAIAERQPLLLAVDDLHWADPASLDYLGFLLPRLEDMSLLLAVTSRPDEPGSSPGLARLVADAVGLRLQPRALSRDATAVLLGAELGAPPAEAFTAACHEVSGGNPFLLDELVRTLAQQAIGPDADQVTLVRELVPERVTRTVAVRLERLSRAACMLARALVVLGDDSEPRNVAALAGLDAGCATLAADELRAAAILDPAVGLRFIHPLVRNALRSEQGAGEHATEHARAAALLREQGASAEQLAAHLVASDPCGNRAAVATLVEAGGQALASGAPRSAIAYLTRALREPPPPELRAGVLLPLVVASIAAADHAVYGAIEADVLDMLEHDPTAGDLATVLVGAWMAANGRAAEARAYFEAGVERSTRAGDVERAFRLDSLLSGILFEARADARARLEPYVERLVPDSLGGRIAAAVEAEWSLSDEGAARAAELALHALADDRALDMLPELLTLARPVAVLAAADHDAARSTADRLVLIARERGATPPLVGTTMVRGLVQLRAGELAAAEADLRRATEIARLGGLWVFVELARALLIEVLLERGELTAVGDAAGEPDITLQVPPNAIWIGQAQLARGRVQLARGRPQQAAEILVALHDRQLERGVAGSPLVPAAGWAARALAAIGERGRALELADEQLAHATRWGAPSALSNAWRARALVVGGADGVELLQQAVAGLEGTSARLERAHALSELGMALRRDKRRAQARAPLEEALELARRCGAAGLARHVSDELEACGARRRRHTPIGAGSLTPSERRVAELAATGITNREIAQALFLTVKTVEAHLSASYDKLGIGSRRRLSDALVSAPS